MVRAATNVEESARPAAAVVADPAILEAPHREAAVGHGLFERRDVRNVVLRKPASAVNEYHHRVRAGAFGEPQVAKLQCTRSVLNFVIRWRRYQRRQVAGRHQALGPQCQGRAGSDTDQ